MANGPVTHRYHAEATALEGELKLPLAQTIERQAYAKVHEDGGYLSQHSKPFRVEGIVSYAAAHTQVSGHEEEKHGNPFVTLSTSVVEDLNILNVVTADRVIAQVSTEHPRAGYIPSVTFVGTQFVNLRIAGHPVEVDLDWEILHDYPGGKQPITRHEGLFKRLGERLGFTAPDPNTSKDLPPEDKTEFSLVKGIRNNPFPEKCKGHVIDIPHFGKIYLAVVRILHTGQKEDVYRETHVELTMVEAVMGCIASGNVNCCVTKNNGSTDPG
jgi:hypothetical protein